MMDRLDFCSDEVGDGGQTDQDLDLSRQNTRYLTLCSSGRGSDRSFVFRDRLLPSNRQSGPNMLC